MPLITPARVRVSCAVVLLAFAGGLVGCGDGASQETLKVQAAASKLSVVSSLMTHEERTQAYNGIVNDLREVETPAASLLAAQATAGLGELELEKANALSADVLGTVGTMRGEIEAYIRLRAVGRGIASQDLSDQIASLDSDAQGLSDRLNTAEARLEALDAEIARINDERQQRLDSARALREEAIGLRAGIEGLSASGRTSTLAEIREIVRRSDRLEVEASTLSIELGDAELQRRMVVAELELLQGTDGVDAEELEGVGLIRSNADSRGSTVRIENQVRQQGQQLRTRVNESRDALVASYQQLVSEYRSDAQTRFEEALSKFGQAAGGAQRASNGLKGGRSAVVQFRSFEATAHVSRGTVESTIAELGRDLAAVLDDPSGVADLASALEESARSSLEAAADAYDNAGVLLEGAEERATAIRVSLGLEQASSGDGMSGGADDMDQPMDDGMDG